MGWGWWGWIAAVSPSYGGVVKWISGDNVKFWRSRVFTSDFARIEKKNGFMLVFSGSLEHVHFARASSQLETSSI